MTKHDFVWLDFCRDSSNKLSNCPRRKFGCVLVNPERNSLIAHGYNGAPRNGTKLCGGDHVCAREMIKSGTEIQIGCIHAEMNAICNAAYDGISTAGAHAYVNGYPCLMCAKLLYQSGIVKVHVVHNDYDTQGINFLRHMNVAVEVHL